MKLVFFVHFDIISCLCAQTTVSLHCQSKDNNKERDYDNIIFNNMCRCSMCC